MDEIGSTGAIEHCLIMMAKFPAQGQVKTRLAAEIGEEQAVELSKRFILDLLQTLSSSDWALRLALYPWEKNEEMAVLIGGDIVQVPQRGGELGERMGNVFIDHFADGFSKIVMIGSDAPDLPLEFIDETFTALADHDAVLGPACDGGYYLIGFRQERFSTQIFDGLPWSTPELFPQQLKQIREQGLAVYILPPWQDIDTLADLKKMAGLAGMTPFADSLTMEYIGASGLLYAKGSDG